MPARAHNLVPALCDGDRLTRDEFMQRWEAMSDLKFAELLDGVVQMASPVSNSHGFFHTRITVWVGQYMDATPGCEGGVESTWLNGGG